MSTTTMQIEDGPSKFDLMTSLFVWKPQRHRVRFKTPGAEFEAAITSCEAEDGSGESWNLKGFIYPLNKNASQILESSCGKRPETKTFKSYFRTGDRKGSLILTYRE